MPRKIRELIRDLQSAGFEDRGGKGSQLNFTHPAGVCITISGNPGDDARPYQEKSVKKALEAIGDEG
jgi:predicted RNA binding protein YcfA (HicA-like mRNA interferase family)